MAIRGRKTEFERGLLAREVAVLEGCERGFASDALARLFRGADLSPRERARLARGAYAVLRAQRRIDASLDAITAKPLRGVMRQRARWIAQELRDGQRDPFSAAALYPAVDWSSFAQAWRQVTEASSPVLRLAIAHSLSDDLAAQLHAQHGEKEASRIAGGLDQPAPVTLRANRLQTSRDALAEELRALGATVRDGELAPDSLTVEGEVDLFRTALFTQGRFELQDEGSQLIGEIVAPPPGARVIDFCAGAGGKSLHLASLLQGRGRVLAFDLPRAATKLAELKRRARRAGAQNVEVAALDPAVPTPPALARWMGKAARVLVDAPCSGVGSLRRNPEARLRIDRAMLDRLPEQQLEILERAAQWVEPGGRLIYSTCTLLRDENDQVVDRFLTAHPEFGPVSLKEVVGRARALRIGDGERLRLFPHLHGTDGFFAAILRRAPSRT